MTLRTVLIDLAAFYAVIIVTLSLALCWSVWADLRRVNRRQRQMDDDRAFAQTQAIEVIEAAEAITKGNQP